MKLVTKIHTIYVYSSLCVHHLSHMYNTIAFQNQTFFKVKSPPFTCITPFFQFIVGTHKNHAYGTDVVKSPPFTRIHLVKISDIQHIHKLTSHPLSPSTRSLFQKLTYIFAATESSLDAILFPTISNPPTLLHSITSSSKLLQPQIP